jgi:predicted ribosome quality control (RQC) complex YloA/Tae2 family protein
MDPADTVSLRKEIQTTEAFKIKLSEGLAHFNKYLAMECLQSSGSLNECFEGLKDVLHRLKTEKPRIYWLYTEPKLFSLIDLTHYRAKHPALREEIFESVNEAIQAYVAQKTSFRQKEKKLQDLMRGIRIRIKKSETLAASLREEKITASDYGSFEQNAHLLNVHISEVKRGMSSITVENIYDAAQKPIGIELNPEWTPQKNIEHYFSQSKKMKQSVKKIEERIRILESETANLKIMLIELEDAEKRDWKKIEKTYEEFVRSGWIKKASVETRAKLEKEPPAFREFVVPGNWRVFVGQNDTKNDQLTFKFAKSDDYWFHARGVPGSHVVLKRDSRKDNPGKQAIETAASIAAFFSKAKSSSLVPVAYTLKKYVRKPKGSRPGQVVIEREEVVIVPPREPQEKIRKPMD